MRKFWESTLTGRVIITLGCGVTAFWFLSESIMFYSRYLRSIEIIQNELAWKLSHVVDLEDDRYREAEKQIQTVMNLWSSLKSGAVLSVAVKHAVFAPFDKVAPNQEQVQKALEIIEISGDPEDCSHAEAFLLLPGQGIVFHKPDSLTPDYLRHRMQAVLALTKVPARHGYHWGEPFPDASKNLYVPVAVIQPDTGVMVGKNVEVKMVLTPNHELQDSIEFALQSDAGGPPAFNKGSEESEPADFALSNLSHCDPTVATRVKDFYIVCKPLAGPPWRIVARYPVSAVASKALVLLLGTLPWTLMLLLLLLLMMFLVLWLQVGRPLQHMIEVIDKSRPPDLNQHLPEKRKDELGRIARAYNRFLITIKTHYRTLEGRVCERTRELDEAKCIAELMRHRKREHIASISHELRTPLNGIVAALSLLQHSRLPAEQRELVRTARLSSDYLLAIINDLLDFSHIEAGQLELSCEQTALLPLLDQAMLTIHLKAQEKQLALRALVMADVPNELLLDPMRVQQILINLLGNAVKFTRHGHIHLLAQLRGGMLAITVEDSGIGIPEASQRDIFRPFVQVRSHENANGLGLAIASRLAKLMGGGILLDSQVGVGSCFTLLLPLRSPSGTVQKFVGALLAPAALHMQLRIWGIAADAGVNPRLDAAELAYLPGRLWQRVAALLHDEPAEEQRMPAEICPWTLKILLVDDVALNRAIVGKMLRELGQQVETAASGQEALQLGRQHVFDLVLMDVRMPGMDGMATTQRWRDPGCGMLDQDAPIIALTANAMPAQSERVKAAGMNGILTKPVGLEQLMEAIASAASLQLARGVDLAPNQALQKPMLNLADTGIRDQLHATFMSLFESIDAAWQSHERAALMDLLHVLKGCAGQGRVERVGNATEQLEVLLQQGGWPGPEDIDNLGKLLTTGAG